MVDALEHDMGSFLATKQDLALLKQDLGQELALLKQDLDHRIELVRRDMDLLLSSMTVRLGSIQVVAAGLLFAALKST